MSEFGQQLPGGQFGPVLRGGSSRRGPDWRRLGVLGATLLALLSVTGVALAGALVWYGERSVQRIDVDGRADADAQRITEVRNVLVVGNDSRAGLTREQLLALGTEDHGGKLTDTIMLLQIDPNREKVALLSFPRDLYVTRCDGSRGRINAAYGLGERIGAGGPTCLVRTVTELTGIPVHHYVEIDFAGFIRVVDTLGGVTMYFDEPLRDRAAGLDVPAGCVHLDGVRALGFVRARKDLDSDFGRIARQQRFIRELLEEATRFGTVLNVPRLFSLVDAIGSALETDRDLSLNDMRRIAFSLRHMTNDGLDTRTVPAVGRRVGGAAVQVPKEPEAEQLFAAFRDGTVFPDGLGTQAPGAVTLADVPPIVVLNGAGVPGLAAQAQEALQRHGLQVLATGNADAFGYTRPIIYHPAERSEEAELLAALLPGAERVAQLYDRATDIEERSPFTIVLGSAFDPADVPEPAPAASPAPEPTPAYVGATPSEHSC